MGEGRIKKSNSQGTEACGILQLDITMLLMSVQV